jgi:hypothetical protein
MARWRNRPMWPYLRSNDPWKGKALWCCCWKELGHGTTTTVHEREEAHSGNGASVLCSGSKMARERAGARVRVSGGSVAPLKTPRPDRWGHDQCTVATTRPRIGTGLWPVSHRGRCHSERTPTQVTDSAILSPFYS